MKDKILYGILFCCFGILVTVNYLKPKPINWSPSFSKKDKIPYGNYILYKQLKDVFPKGEISLSKKSLSQVLKNNDSNDKSNLFLINNELNFTHSDEKLLLDFVGKGNKVFMSAANFSPGILDSLNLTLGTILKAEEDSSTLIINGIDGDYRSFGYKHLFSGYIERFDKNNSESFGWINGDKTMLIKIKYGKGFFLVSTTPFAFTNYHMLTYDNHNFVSNVFSHLPNENCIWDEYYKIGRKYRESRSPLRVILSSSSLKMAYYLAILSLLLFMVFGLKRRQKIIPVMEPNTNTSLEFIRTVGQLYYNKATHKELLHKKWNYFKADVREKFSLNTPSTPNEQFVDSLAGLSGVEREIILGLISYFEILLSKQKITDEELIKINAMVDEFYKTSKR